MVERGNNLGGYAESLGVEVNAFGPLRKGSLPEEVANSFRSSSYRSVKLDKPVRLYRVYSNEKYKLSSYWSRIKPEGSYQATLDYALNPKYNHAVYLVEIEVPVGETIYMGKVGELVLKKFVPPVEVGKIIGGGDQIYIDVSKIEKKWIKQENIPFSVK